MSSFGIASCGDVTIPNGSAASPAIKWREQYEDALDITIFVPSALNGLAGLKIQVTPDPDAAAPVWYDLNSATLPAAGLAQTFSIVAKGFRIFSTANATADTTFKIQKRFPMYGD